MVTAPVGDDPVDKFAALITRVLFGNIFDETTRLVIFGKIFYD
jgi:hypothetical protein